MSLTQEEIYRQGYKLRAAPEDSWRNYNEVNPVPGYFEFDWLSSRHPDLYHQFALSTVGLMKKLHTLIDLTGCDVIDIGAGTGRSAIGAAQKARKVYAIDRYESVVIFGQNQLRLNHTPNVIYTNADRTNIPFQENRFDMVINAWAELDPLEAYRVLKPDGLLIQLGSVPNALCGELTALLAPDYPWVPKDCTPEEEFRPDYPDKQITADSSIWNGIPVKDPINIHQFTYMADYQDYAEIAAISGRLYGPKARHYFLSKKQSTFAWRLQIIIGQVSK